MLCGITITLASFFVTMYDIGYGIWQVCGDLRSTISGAYEARWSTWWREKWSVMGQKITLPSTLQRAMISRTRLKTTTLPPYTRIVYRPRLKPAASLKATAAARSAVKIGPVKDF